MNSRERAKAMRDLERLIQRAANKGWTLEELTTTDERNEDFHAVIRLSIAGYEPERKGVI